MNKKYSLTAGGAVIRASDSCGIPADPANSDYQDYLVWVAAGNNPDPVGAPTTQERIAACEAALDSYLDSVARQRRYADRVSCALRAGYAGPFQAEGEAFALWMDNCNALAYSLLAEVNAGTRPMPEDPQDLIALLPPMVWPA